MLSSFASAAASAASAAASAASKMVSGDGLPFDTGAEITSYAGKSPWRMYHGKKEGFGDVSLFLYQLKDKQSDRELSQVRNSIKRLRTIKHPYLLKCIEAGEKLDTKGGGIIYLVTEPVQPLAEVLDALLETPGGIAWGVYTLAAAIKFLNIDCNIVHGQVQDESGRGMEAHGQSGKRDAGPRAPSLPPVAWQVCVPSLFVDRGMDWKLGGFEMLVEATAADSEYFAMAKETLPRLYQSPELGRGQVDVLGRIPVAADWWALGCTVFEVFCGPIKSMADLKNTGNMPEVLRPDYMRMLSSNPTSRLRPAEFLGNPIFEEEYVSLQLFLETLNVKDGAERPPTPTHAPQCVPSSHRRACRRQPSRRTASSQSSPRGCQRCPSRRRSGRCCRR